MMSPRALLKTRRSSAYSRLRCSESQTDQRHKVRTSETGRPPEEAANRWADNVCVVRSQFLRERRGEAAHRPPTDTNIPKRQLFVPGPP